MATAFHPMITDGDEPAPLAAAAALCRRLTDAGVSFGVYKEVTSVSLGLAGLEDLDLLVAARDIQQARTILTSLGGICGAPSRFHDNSESGREDWFIPDDSGGFLHLDLAVDLRVGRKFRKRYPALAFDGVVDWSFFAWAGESIRVVSPLDEARIAILHSVFRLRTWPAKQWVAAAPGLASVARAIFLPATTEHRLRFAIGGEEIMCRLRLSGGTVELDSASIRQLRRAIRTDGGFGPFAGWSDWLTHGVRQCSYLLARSLTRSDPGRTAARRSLQPSGMVVAIVGPDGAGKSSQTKRVSETFQRKFKCRTLYLGSNDGGFMLRRLVGKYRRVRKAQGRQPGAAPSAPSADGGGARGLASAAWRLIVAFQRYLGVQKAMRLARSGTIVITDRWPQNLEPGILDGPSVLEPGASWPRLLLSAIERQIYRRMERFEPSLTIHLISDFETSDRRKPGEIRRDAIERRLSLMQSIRDRDPSIAVVDSRQNMDEVTRMLLQKLWFALWDHSTAANRRRTSRHDPVVAPLKDRAAIVALP